MPDEITFRLPVRSLFAALLVSPLAAVALWWVAGWPWSSSNAPAWVQAVGSVVAILASMYIAGAKDRRDDQAKRRQDVVFCSMVSQIVTDVRSQTLLMDIASKTGTDSFGFGPYRHFGDEMQHNLGDVLDGINVSAAPTSEIAVGILGFRGAFRGLMRTLKGEGVLANENIDKLTYDVQSKELVRRAQELELLLNAWVEEAPGQ